MEVGVIVLAAMASTVKSRSLVSDCSGVMKETISWIMKDIQHMAPALNELKG